MLYQLSYVREVPRIAKFGLGRSRLPSTRDQSKPSYSTSSRTRKLATTTTYKNNPSTATA
jgi:hypothetical protein